MQHPSQDSASAYMDTHISSYPESIWTAICYIYFCVHRKYLIITLEQKSLTRRQKLALCRARETGDTYSPFNPPIPIFQSCSQLCSRPNVVAYPSSMDPLPGNYCFSFFLFFFCLRNQHLRHPFPGKPLTMLLREPIK